jgi:hypothetical protein
MDTDCEIVDGDVVAEVCCGSCSEPYAISKVAAERHVRRAQAKCADTPCLAWRRLCCNTRRSDWKAVCSDHVCERRSATFFSPKPQCS